MKTITSRHNPLVRRYRDVAAGRLPTLMLLDGAHLVQEAARTGLPIESVACTRPAAHAEVRHIVELVQATAADVFFVTDEVLHALSPVRSPSGIVALATRPDWSLSQVFTMPAAGIHAAGSRPAAPLVVVASGVQDPGNIGAIVRAAEAGGAGSVIFMGATADPFGWKALRGSMGSALRLPIVTAAVNDVLVAARATGVRLLATVPRHGNSIFETDLRGGVAFVLGGEGPGLSEDLVDAADERVSIPMRAPVESLNVAVAAALLVYEASRQRARG